MKQLLGNILIADKPTNEFKIVRTQNKYIYLGMIDKKYINDQNSWDAKRKELIFYDVYNGGVYESGQKKADGKKAEQGETVAMKVEGQTIYWGVGG